MFCQITTAQRAATTRCLDVEMTPSTTRMGHWDCQVEIVDPAMSYPPYSLLNVTPEDLGRQLDEWSAWHGGPDGPLPVYFAKVEPQVLAKVMAYV